MKLPGVLSRLTKQKEDKRKLLLAVLIEYAKITTAVFSISDKQVEVLSFRSAPYSGEIGESVEVIDHLLGGLSDQVPAVDNIHEAIFGFPQEFVTAEDKIKPEILDGLKESVQKLSLKPVGFVVISEALAHYISTKTGTQESAIFVGIFSRELRVSLAKIGKLIEEKTIPRTENICADLEEVLNSFNQDVLPAKMVLYNSTHDLRSVQEKCLNYAWERRCNFLHFPKIDILPPLATLKAVVGAYTEKSVVSVKDEARDQKKSPLETVSPEELGFAVDEQEPAEQADEQKPPKTAVPGQTATVEEREDSDKEVQSHETPSRLPKLRLPRISLGLPDFSGLFRRIPGKKALILLLTGLSLFGGVWWYSGVFANTASIRILVDGERYEQDLTFTLDPEASQVDLDQQTIPGKSLSAELEESASTDSTGTELIGEPAKGKVTIYNKTTDEIDFSKGEVLIADNKTEFILEEEVKVASASETVDALTYGKAEAGVVAQEIGPEGNLSSDTEFVFEDYSEEDYFARSTEAFTGGSSREISVIAASDLDDLRDTVISKAKDKALDKLRAQSGGELVILEETLESEVIDEKFSAQSGEQAKSVSLEAKVEFSALAYDQDDIAALLREKAKAEMPAGFTMEESKTAKRIVDKTVHDDGSVSLQAEFITLLVPQLDTEELRTLAAGSSVRELEGYLKQQKQIGGFEIAFADKPPFLERLPLFNSNTLPQDPNNITVSVITR